MGEGSAREFYDDLAGDYDLIYSDWNASIRRQGVALDRLIVQVLGAGARHVLDCACGIGTQAIGLAQLGHRLVGSDVSPVAAARAGVEAVSRDLTLSTAAADMRCLPFRSDQFDVVVCADNAIAHLLTPANLSTALASMRRVLRPGGLLILTTRTDYARENHPASSPLQTTQTPAGRVVTFQLWDWHPDGAHYDMQHIQLLPIGDGDNGSTGDSYEVRVRRTTSWAFTRHEVTDLVRAAGFTELDWHSPEDSGFFQPVLTGRTPAA